MNRQLKNGCRFFCLLIYVGTFMPEEKRNESGAYQDAKFFSYNGKILNDIRQEIEKEGPENLEKEGPQNTPQFPPL